ncbi:KAP family P-loop NTPase fold protein [Knoellia sp. LjRoot47]|uniref:KAP family P-loop NTPase fold protein n=1 Tax=Knoellia sp. LjRoot47 TaxID=3342330 RepID=UPI003ECE3840
MTTSYEPPPPPGSASVGDVPDPVVAMIEAAGLVVGPGVAECDALAAAAHGERYSGSRADGPLVNRSTMLWALGRTDDGVRAALAENGVDIDRFGREELKITGEPVPTTEPFGLDRELTRALTTYVQPSASQRTVIPWSLAIAVLGDVVAHGGLLDTRLRKWGAEPEAIVRTLLRMTPGETPPSTPADELPRMREVSPQRFGVQLRAGDELRPYVRRDADDELDRQLREGEPVVTIIAPAVSGAARTAYEALLRGRGDDRVLLLHEVVEGRVGDNQIRADELEALLTSGAEVVWVRNLGELLFLHPALEEWFRARGDAVAATIVLVIRPGDVLLAGELGLMSPKPVELTVSLSVDEHRRAQTDYEGEVTRVGEIASALLRRGSVRRANYSADSAIAELLDDRHDDLGILADVDMLARLIASKDVHPPLSIGLFGPWGSGKSFIMDQVRQRIERLAEQSKALDQRNAEARAADPDAEMEETGYLREILPVEFNAWQYAHGTALWAALINRVFEQIREQLGNDDRYRKVLEDIADKDIAVAQARTKVDEAQAVVDDSRLAAEDRVIDDVAKDHGMGADSTKQIKEGLDLDVATQQVSELKAEYDRLMTTRSRLLAGWSTATPGRKTLVVGLVVLGLVGLALYVWSPETYGQLVALATGALSLVGAATQVLKPLNKGLEQAATVLKADDADKQRLQRAQDALAVANAELAKTKASGLAGLYGFVSERSTAAEYTQQLGMAPRIRDDLERLADKSREAEGLPGIDRIVIFIDDLDRCPASEVIRVLEAVNLLFGFELFVVVVAVDSRWLIRSLDGQFSEAFDKRDPEAPTPQNYLEKIIQIPFWVQPMRPQGFGRLVTSLAGEVDASPRRVATGASGGSGSADGDGSGAALPSGQVWGGHGPPAGAGAGVTSPDPDGSGSASPLDGAVGSTTVHGDRDTPVVDPVAEAAEDLNPAALRLTSDERDVMMTFLPLIATPRAVKRFLNTYQLLRVSVDDVDAFLERKEYEPVLVLLALMTGTARLDDGMVRDLRAMEEPNLERFLAGLPEPSSRGEKDAYAGWRLVRAACDALPTEKLTPQLVDTWMPLVARYSFHHVDA